MCPSWTSVMDICHMCRRISHQLSTRQLCNEWRWSWCIHKPWGSRDWKDSISGSMEWIGYPVGPCRVFGDGCLLRSKIIHGKAGFFGPSCPKIYCKYSPASRIRGPSSQSPSVITSQRHLRNYCKVDSAHLWSYSSQSFSIAGFCPTHPLAIDHHPAKTRAKYKDKASLASLALNVVVSRHLTSDHRHTALTILEITKEFKHISTADWASVSTIGNALSIFERTVPNAGILHPLRILNQLDILPQSEHCRISHLLNNAKIREDIRTMYSQSIAPAIKSCNQKALKELVKQ